jgi:Protein of unknown function (DUF3558)
MRRYLPALTTTALAAILVTGCTNDGTGGATPSGNTTTTSPAAASSSSSGAPKVATPLNTDRYQQAPCDVLTRAQIAGIFDPGVTPKPNVDSPAGPACNFNRDDPAKGAITVIFGNDGLDRIYDGRGTTFKVFEPKPEIQGYPAVAYDADDNRQTKGRCTIAIGTSDTTSLDVGIVLTTASIAEHKDPCASAYEVATTIMGNITGGR